MSVERKYFIHKQMLILLCIFSSMGVWATEYRINSASELDALTLVSGDTVIMENGIWENQDLRFVGTGTEFAPIVLRAETGGSVILSGSSNLRMSGEYLVVDGLFFRDGAINSDAIISFRTSSSEKAFNCRLTNTRIQNYNPASKSTEYKWVSLYGQYNRVDHCHFEGKTNSGALLVVWLDAQPNYHKIDSNYFGNRPDLGYNGGETIRVGTSDWSMYDSYTVVESNLFESCDGEIEIISNKSCKNVYRYNTFRNSEGSLTLRHGNDCEVYSNFFFGNDAKDCGGIRIIGENHRVYNNYLQDIPGDEYRAAISIVNGVPESPLNRYFQVINAEVVNNTLVNCKHPIVLGAGVDAEKSLPPKDCKIANNVVGIYSSSTLAIIEYQDEPINITFQNNMVFGADLGIPEQQGIELLDPQLSLDGIIWRPDALGPVEGFGTMEYTYLTFDIDGQSRSARNDVGCDQFSTDDIVVSVIDSSQVGVPWEDPLKEVSAADGGLKLREYINSASDGLVIVLTSSGGIYELDTSAFLSADIRIVAAEGLNENPKIIASGEVDAFITILDGSRLELEGIDLDGGGNSINAFAYAFQTSDVLDPGSGSSLLIDDCNFTDFTHSSGGNILNVVEGVLFDQISISNTQVFEVSKEMLNFNLGSRVSNLQMVNCTFANVGRELILMKEEQETQAAISVNHCTIDGAAYEGGSYAVFSFANSNAEITNSLFTYCNKEEAAFILYDKDSSLENCLFFETGVPTFSGGGAIGSNNLVDINPLYFDRSDFNFSFLKGSPALYAAGDGENLGDLFWSKLNTWNRNALLKGIYLNEELINGFKASVFNYITHVLDEDSYVLSAFPFDTNATVEIFLPASLPGSCDILVRAEDQITTQSYKLDLHELGSSAYLSALLIDDVPLDEFDPIQTNYTASIQNPNKYAITAVTEDEFAAYEVIYPASIPGTAYIEVRAEDDINVIYYSVFIDVISGVNNTNEGYGFNFYPNPCNSNITINANRNGELQIISIKGIILKKLDVVTGRNLIDTSDLEKGIYLLEFSSGVHPQIELFLVE